MTITVLDGPFPGRPIGMDPADGPWTCSRQGHRRAYPQGWWIGFACPQIFRWRQLVTPSY